MVGIRSPTIIYARPNIAASSLPADQAAASLWYPVDFRTKPSRVWQTIAAGA
jgi:hypothetical protein